MHLWIHKTKTEAQTPLKMLAVGNLKSHQAIFFFFNNYVNLEIAR